MYIYNNKWGAGAPQYIHAKASGQNALNRFFCPHMDFAFLLVKGFSVLLPSALPEPENLDKQKFFYYTAIAEAMREDKSYLLARFVFAI